MVWEVERELGELQAVAAMVAGAMVAGLERKERSVCGGCSCCFALNRPALNRLALDVASVALLRLLLPSTSCDVCCASVGWRIAVNQPFSRLPPFAHFLAHSCSVSHAQMVGLKEEPKGCKLSGCGQGPL